MSTNSYVTKRQITDPLPFLIDSNNGPKLLVIAEQHSIKIYSLDRILSDYCHTLTNSNETHHWDALIDCFYADDRKRLIRNITQFKGLWTGFDPSYYHLHFRTVLIKINTKHYIDISNSKFHEFRTTEPIIDFFGYMGENNVTYTYAISEHNVYFINVCQSPHAIAKMDIPFPVTVANAKRLIAFDCV